jgi:hypothetical protein
MENAGAVSGAVSGPDFIPMLEAAVLLGVSLNTLYAWLRKGGYVTETVIPMEQAWDKGRSGLKRSDVERIAEVIRSRNEREN